MLRECAPTQQERCPLLLCEQAEADTVTSSSHTGHHCVANAYDQPRRSLTEAVSEGGRSRMEVPVGIAPTHGGFADPCLTAWLRHQ